MNENIIQIEFQHFEGCPNGPKLLKNLEDAVAGMETQVVVREILVETPEDLINYKFRGSPSIIINGEDFDELPEPEEPKFSCRLYPGGLPTAEQIKKRLESLLQS